jgi:hypothetical protein
MEIEDIRHLLIGDEPKFLMQYSCDVIQVLDPEQRTQK